MIFRWPERFKKKKDITYFSLEILLARCQLYTVKQKEKDFVYDGHKVRVLFSNILTLYIKYTLMLQGPISSQYTWVEQWQRHLVNHNKTDLLLLNKWLLKNNKRYNINENEYKIYICKYLR